MRAPLVVLYLSLLLIAGALVFTSVAPRAHAALTGIVCLQPPSSPSVAAGKPCSAASPTFDGPVPGSGQTLPTLIRIGVYLNSSDAMNGFDITLIADHTILRAAGVDTTGTVVPGPSSVIVECLSGVLVSGPRCATTDTVDTLHFAFASFNSITTAPTTGLLFTAIYNITGTASVSGISVGFQTGCTLGPPTSDPPFCVTVSTGTSNVPDAENIQTAVFNNNAAPPWIAVSSNTTSLTFFSGNSVGNHAAILATAKNLWPRGSSDSVSFISPTISGLSPIFTPSSCATGGSSCSTVMTLNGAAGNYTLTVLGQYVLSDPSFPGQTDTLDGPVTYQVTIRDFNLTANPAMLSFNAGSSVSSILTLTSLNGFSASMSLSALCASSSGSGGSGSAGAGRHAILMVPPSLCPVVSLSSSSFSLSRGTSASSVLNVSAVNSVGTYSISVTAQSSVGSIHRLIITLVISDFNITASPANAALTVTSSGTSTLTLKSQISFAGNVALSAKIFPTGLTVSFNPSSVTLTAGGSASSTVTFSAPTGTPTGNYELEIIATGGGIPHTVDIFVQVNPQGFIVTFVRVLAQPTVFTVLGVGFLGIIVPLAFIPSRSRPRNREYHPKWTVSVLPLGPAVVFPLNQVRVRKRTSLEELRH